jgi:hypothetical protein
LKLSLAALGAGAVAGVAAVTGRRRSRALFSADAERWRATARGDDAPIEHAMLERLPDPVIRWLELTGIVGHERVRTVHLRQSGRLRSAPEKSWIEFLAEQYTVVDPPTLLWLATATVGGLPVLVAYDRLVEGHGMTDLSLSGRIPLGSSSGPEVDEAAMHRFLAEIVSVPSAALAPYVAWTPVDERAARATMTLGPTRAEATFHFGDDGHAERITAERYRTIPHGFVKTPWTAGLSHPFEENGIVTPHAMTSTWHLAEGDFTALELEITSVEYDSPSR